MEKRLTVAMPHCGLAANSTSGGEVVERELLSRIVEHDIDPHILRPSWRGLRWWNSALYFGDEMGRCVREHQPGLIRVHSLRYAGPAAVWMKRRTQLPLVAHFHHLEEDRLSWLDRWILRQADLVTTDSEFSRSQAQAIGVQAVAIPLGVTHPRDQTTMPPGQIVLAFGGNKGRKNLPFLLRLWPDVAQAVPGARLVIVGPGHWLPRSDAAVQRLYGQARVVAMPSRLEGFGLPVLEAMAAGRPVVCSDRTALPELRAESTIPLDPPLWIATLIRYLTDDPSWYQAALANQIRSRQYSWERTAQRTAEAWRSLA